MSIHEAASRGFASAADAYERSRPGYPPEAIAWLAESLRLAEGRTVVDLAAGTGKLTAPLAATGARVIAVEPISEMLEILRRRVPTAEARTGTAEATGLSDDCADAVTVAQAFHWFDGPAALAEIDRILRPGGRLALAWNVRDLDHPTQRAVHALLAPHRGATPSHRSGRWRRAFDHPAPFARASLRHFPNVETLDAEGLRQRIESTSFIAALPTAELEAVRAGVRQIAAELPERFPFPYTTEIELFDRPELSSPPPDRARTEMEQPLEQHDPATDAETERVRAIQDKTAPKYDRQIAFFERILFADGREWACSKTAGRVLEIAVGTGRNLPHYAVGTELTGIELSDEMLAIARRRAAELGVEADLRQGDAQALEFGDQSFDTVVITLALCTIPDDRAAAREAQRVLRPGGRLVLLEHVRSPARPVRAVQRVIDPLSVRFQGDHVIRDPLDYLTAEGFEIESVERLKWGIVERLVARRPA